MVLPWLFNVYMDGVVREVNTRVLGVWLKLLGVNGGRFEINQLFNGTIIESHLLPQFFNTIQCCLFTEFIQDQFLKILCIKTRWPNCKL